jgi:glutaminyl-tRNA synthetase
MTDDSTQPAASNFIRTIVQDDLASGKHTTVRTRFPPEPNGYLHIGHAKAICLDFGLAEEFGGTCNLRFDDSNPAKEKQEYVDAAKEDVNWLGFEWDGEFYASDYFEQLYEFAVKLVADGKAYVDDLSGDEIREYRGTLTEPGKESPYRDRSVDENLDLLARMKAGEFPDGTRVLRAKIDMSAGNLNMRDPVLYRIVQHAHHYRRGDDWKIYPTYDFTHGQSDSIEKITHSLCTLEFEDHRPLYDWFIEQLEIYPSRQIEFARLNITRTILSKRKLLQLVEAGLVDGWDDPRMPTISGLRRRGYTPEAIRDFCDRIGVAKANSTVDVAMLEHCLREHLNKEAARVMAVLRPLKVVIENYPQGTSEELEAINNPEDEAAGTRAIPFSRELWIERTDFMEEPPKKFFRLAPGREVRLRYGYFITCTDVVKDDEGNVVELRCSYDPETKGGYAADGRKVRGTIHWVSAQHSLPAEVRLYDHLFKDENDDTGEGNDFTDQLNPSSLEVLSDCQVEPSLGGADPGFRCQFERQGYFCVDAKDSTQERLIFNRTVTLRDTWAKIQKKQGS